MPGAGQSFRRRPRNGGLIDGLKTDAHTDGLYKENSLETSDRAKWKQLSRNADPVICLDRLMSSMFP